MADPTAIEKLASGIEKLINESAAKDELTNFDVIGLLHVIIMRYQLNSFKVKRDK